MSSVCIEDTRVAPSGTVRLLDIREQAVTGTPSQSVVVLVPVRIWPTWPDRPVDTLHRFHNFIDIHIYYLEMLQELLV